MNGVQREIPIYEIHDAWQPNAMSTGDKARHWVKQVKNFWWIVRENPTPKAAFSCNFRHYADGDTHVRDCDAFGRDCRRLSA